MLSRVADSLYWMTRYMERNDCMLRMLRVNYASSQDDSKNFTWTSALKIFTYLEDSEIEKLERNSREAIQYIVMDRSNLNSVFNMIMKSRENARAVQDNVTKELWQCLNYYYLLIRESWVEQSLKHGDVVSALDALINQGMLYYGVVESTMFQSEGFFFMNMGKYLERSLQSIDILDVKFRDLDYHIDGSIDTTHWRHLLLSISGYALYLKSYRTAFEGKNVVDQILFNESFPRSLSYSLGQLQRNFEQLRNSSSEENFKGVQFMLGKLYSKIRYCTLDEIVDMGLKNYLDEIREDINEVSITLNQRYFAYS